MDDATTTSSNGANGGDKVLFGFSVTTCHHCGISNDEIGGFLLQCGTCKRVYYCGMKCFNANLPLHSQFCTTNQLEKEPMGRRTASAAASCHEKKTTTVARIGPSKDETTTTPRCCDLLDAAPSTTRRNSKKKTTKQPVVAVESDNKKKKKKKNKPVKRTIIMDSSCSESSESETESESSSETTSKPIVQRNQLVASVDSSNQYKDWQCDNELSNKAVDNSERGKVGSSSHIPDECCGAVKLADKMTGYGNNDNTQSTGIHESDQNARLDKGDSTKDVNVQDMDEEYEVTTSRSRRGGGDLDAPEQQEQGLLTIRSLVDGQTIHDPHCKKKKNVQEEMEEYEITTSRSSRRGGGDLDVDNVPDSLVTQCTIRSLDADNDPHCQKNVQEEMDEEYEVTTSRSRRGGGDLDMDNVPDSLAAQCTIRSLDAETVNEPHDTKNVQEMDEEYEITTSRSRRGGGDLDMDDVPDSLVTQCTIRSLDAETVNEPHSRNNVREQEEYGITTSRSRRGGGDLDVDDVPDSLTRPTIRSFDTPTIDDPHCKKYVQEEMDEEYEITTSRSRRGGGDLDVDNVPDSLTRHTIRSLDAETVNEPNCKKNVQEMEEYEITTSRSRRGGGVLDVDVPQQQQDLMTQRSIRSIDAVAQWNNIRGEAVVTASEDGLRQERHDLGELNASAVPAKRIATDADANPSAVTVVSPNCMSMPVEFDYDVEETRRRSGGDSLLNCSLPEDTAKEMSNVVLRAVVPSKHLLDSGMPEWATKQLRNVGSDNGSNDMNAADARRSMLQDPKLEHLGYRYSTETDIDLADLHFRTQRSSSFTLRSVKHPRKSSMSPGMWDSERKDAREGLTEAFQIGTVNGKAEETYKKNQTEVPRLSRTGSSLQSHSMIDLSKKERFDSMMLRPAHPTKCNVEWAKPEWIDFHLRATQHGAKIKKLGELRETADPVTPAVQPEWVAQRKLRLSGIQQCQLPYQQRLQEPDETNCISIGASGAPSNKLKSSTKRHSLLKYQSCHQLDSGSRSSNLPDIVRRAQALRKVHSVTNRKHCSHNVSVIESPSLDK